MKVTFILLLLLTFAQAKDMSRWDQDSIVRESWKYIQATKNELKTRAARVKKETGQEVPVAFKYFANMTKEQKKFHDKFLKARASKAQTEAHIKGFLADLEKNRKVVAAAERIAEKIWNEKNTSVKDEAPKNKMI
ncbi:MAG: hypothetical protein NE330_01865, partial [Lentisphaeraceae bacterium]|nr:hypothetical protein [Lentisphaeraceae bacterium]